MRLKEHPKMTRRRSSQSQMRLSRSDLGLFARRDGRDNILQDMRIRWVDEEDLDIAVEEGSISSEEGVTTCSTRCPEVEDCPYVHGKRNDRQAIWSHEELSASLRGLSGGEDIATLLEAGDSEAVVRHKNGATTGLLMAAWLDKASLLETILNRHNGSTQISDAAGRTPLHLACCAGRECTSRLLLMHGARAHAWDAQHHATPLHCAASAGSVACVRQLLAAGAEVNAGLTGHSALHYAVRSEAVDCVAELLAHGACPNTPQVFTETPLHVAAAQGSAACIKLLLEYGAGVRVQFGSGKVTPLHLAAEDGNAECARLLLDAAAEANVPNNRLQTPLHLAALSQSAETLELLLKRGGDPNSEDQDGRTPLHGSIVKVSRSCECVKLLLDAGAHVNKADKFGYTPLHIAALNEFSSCVYLLLTYGGDVTVKTKGGASALSFIVRRTPDVLPRFIANLDAAVKLHDHEIGDVDCELKLDFRILVPSVERGESELLLTFIEVGQRHILKHPLCETFLFLKWRRIRKFFIFSLVFHTIFVLLFSTYIMGLFFKMCNSTLGTESEANSTMSSSDFNKPTIPWVTNIAGILLLIVNIILLVKEVFQMCHGWTGYIHYWENWLQWLIIICTFLCLFHPKGFFNTVTCDVLKWQHHVAAIGIFLAWLELMMLVGRFPTFGLYVQMFTTVAVNFSKFLLAYSCLLIAFGLSFGVLFPNYKSFQTTTLALMKTVIMMSGELEFEDIFYGDDGQTQILYPYTSHLIFLAFVLLVTVILTNLLVGLAVSDIQGLQQSAGLDRLVRQAQLVARLESMLFSRLLFCLPQKLLKICQRSALLLTSSYHWALYLRPNDPREKRVPRELINSAFQLVAERKDKPKNQMKHGSTRSERTHNHHNHHPHAHSYCSPMKFNRGGPIHGIRQERDQKISEVFSQMSALLEESQEHEAEMQEKLKQLKHQITLMQDEFHQGNYYQT